MISGTNWIVNATNIKFTVSGSKIVLNQWKDSRSFDSTTSILSSKHASYIDVET